MKSNGSSQPNRPSIAIAVKEVAFVPIYFGLALIVLSLTLPLSCTLADLVSQEHQSASLAYGPGNRRTGAALSSARPALSTDALVPTHRLWFELLDLEFLPPVHVLVSMAREVEDQRIRYPWRFRKLPRTSRSHAGELALARQAGPETKAGTQVHGDARARVALLAADAQDFAPIALQPLREPDLSRLLQSLWVPSPSSSSQHCQHCASFSS